MDRQICQEVKLEIDAAIGKIALAHGLNYNTWNRCTYSTTEMRFKVELQDKAVTKQLIEIGIPNMNKIQVGTKFINRGQQFTVVNLLTNRKMKYNILAERYDGKKFRFTSQAVLLNLVK